MSAKPDVVAAINKLEKAGRLTPAEVVDAARNPKSPLHAYFEWDNDRAADAYRLGQARQLIRSVKITIDYETNFAPAYVPDPDVKNNYVSVFEVRNNADTAKAVCLAEFDRADSALARACSVSVAVGFADSIEEIRDKIRELAVLVNEAF